MLRLVIPKGSLEQATFDLFADADLAVLRSSEVEYRARINDARIDEVRILRPQEIPLYVAAGLFDFGITGRDWVEERSADIVSLGVLGHSKSRQHHEVRVVVAVAADSEVRTLADFVGWDRPVRVSTEYPELTRRAFSAHGIAAEISFSYGATEAKVPDIADCVVDMTETGRALRAAGLRIVDTLLVSHTELIANPASAADPQKRRAMDQVLTLLQGTLEARGKVLVKLNVAEDRLDAVIGGLPSLRSPTVSKLAGGGYAVETVVEKNAINTLIPALKEQGATDILELALSKIVH
jgi:ATP phosphoribosyltransferase